MSAAAAAQLASKWPLNLVASLTSLALALNCSNTTPPHLSHSSHCIPIRLRVYNFASINRAQPKGQTNKQTGRKAIF